NLGTLNISLVNSFDPAVGTQFSIITFASRTGTFATINGLSIPNNKSFTPSYNATNLTLSTGSPLLAAADESAPAGVPQALTQGQLDAVVQAAITRWVGAGIDPASAALLEGIHVQVADLGGSYLGLEGGNVILIDRDAAGYGWFI